jgi:hypothetical protein
MFGALIQNRAQPRGEAKRPPTNQGFAHGKTGAAGRCSCHLHAPVFGTNVRGNNT